ncbi:hydroxymethylpyrimidine kinase [Aureococcus anophagefferens]|uniref:Hydroxymethylpyrimidine kinase n=1 Tax=Aureococcus anophagefferens TaxID=44056 RepID=A0ABR1G295_AURAN
MRAVLVALLWMARASGLRSGPPIAWSIAGSDSGGGAGVEADLRTFRALGVHGCAVVTSLTAQNSLGVAAALETPPSHVAATIAALESDLAPACVKVGMLSGAGAAREVAAFLERNAACRLVLDPVLASSSGRPLLDAAGVAVLVGELLPRCAVATPNAREAEALLGLEPGSVRTAGDVEAAAAAFLGRFGCGSVLLKGGHVDLGDAADFWTDGNRTAWLAGGRVAGLGAGGAHGTGCVLSSALAAARAARELAGRRVVVAKAFCGAAIAIARPARRAARRRRRRTRRRRGPGRAPRRTACRARAWAGASRPGRRAFRPPPPPAALARAVSGALRGAVGRGRARRPAPRQGRAPRRRRRRGRGARARAARAPARGSGSTTTGAARGSARSARTSARRTSRRSATATSRSSATRACASASRRTASPGFAVAAPSPSYAALGPVFGTTSKHVPFSPRGLDLVSDWRALVPGDVPLVAIGGVTLERGAPSTLGADGIAVISALPEDGAAEAAASWTALCTTARAPLGRIPPAGR